MQEHLWERIWFIFVLYLTDTFHFLWSNVNAFLSQMISWVSISDFRPQAIRWLTDSLKDEVGSGVEAPADFVVGGEREDPRPAAGPHTPAVQRIHRLTQTHERRAAAAHGERLHRLPALLLQGGTRREGRSQEGEEYRLVHVKHGRRKSEQKC